jgi:DNA-binding transcriptional LysR family regulator
MTDKVYALRVFARVARTGSFSKAARELKISQPSVSRISAELERQVGVALLLRSTRAVTLTEAGAEYLARIEPILTALDEADHAARGNGELRGRLRVGASISFTIREVLPRLATFLDRHPGLGVDFVTTDHRQDLILEGMDVALRFGSLPDSTAVARLLGVTERLLAASPAYLAKWGHPTVPADLPRHNVILGPAALIAGGWSFEKDGRRTSVRVDGRVSITVNDGATAAAVAGLGIISTGAWSCRAELRSGALVRILEDWKMEPAEVNAIFPAGRAAKPAARAFVEYLATQLKGELPSV